MKSNRGEIFYEIPYMWNLQRSDINELTTQKQIYRLGEQTYGCQSEGVGEGIVQEFGMDTYTLLYLKWIIKKNLLYST